MADNFRFVKIGILSDTHDCIQPTRVAIGLLLERGAEQLIHCGDVGGEEIIDQLAGHHATFVWGNNDFDRDDLAAYAQGIGVHCAGTLADLTLDGKRIAVTHGDDARIMQHIESSGDYDYLLHGHTHVRRDQRAGRLRIINPGALHRAKTKSVALLDLANDRLEYFSLAD